MPSVARSPARREKRAGDADLLTEGSLSEHFVFVRFFLGYATDFPFQRFAHLGDEAIKAELQALRAEWWSDPANVSNNKKQQKELRRRVREWNDGALLSPTVAWAPPPKRVRQEAKKEVFPWLERPLKSPRFSSDYPDWAAVDAITHRYPLARFDSKEAADVAAAALQTRVEELARTALAKQNFENEDNVLATANPRFFVISAAQLTAVDRLTTEEQLDRLWGAPQASCPEEGFLRFYMPRIRGTLERVGYVAGNAASPANRETSAKQNRAP